MSARTSSIRRWLRWSSTSKTWKFVEACTSNFARSTSDLLIREVDRVAPGPDGPAATSRFRIAFADLGVDLDLEVAEVDGGAADLEARLGDARVREAVAERVLEDEAGGERSSRPGRGCRGRRRSGSRPRRSETKSIGRDGVERRFPLGAPLIELALWRSRPRGAPGESWARILHRDRDDRVERDGARRRAPRCPRSVRSRPSSRTRTRRRRSRAGARSAGGEDLRLGSHELRSAGTRAPTRALVISIGGSAPVSTLTRLISTSWSATSRLRSPDRAVLARRDELEVGQLDLPDLRRASRPR